MATPDPIAATPWKTPSPAVRELFRRGAEISLAAPPEWYEALDAATFPDVAGQSVADDPVLLAASRRTNRAGLAHWASSNIQHPGEPVPAYVSADLENTARELVRRGMPDFLMNSARSVQNVAWQLWMQIAFRLTRDPNLLEELLEVSARSIGAFFEANMRAVSALVQADRDARQRDSHLERRELVTLILDSGQVSPSLASHRLGYPMEQLHYAALIWSEAAAPELRQLEEAAEVLAQSAAAARPLIVLAGSATLWVWFAAPQPLDRRRVDMALRTLPNVRIALGSASRGMDGFRRSHLEAVTVQRVLGRLNAPAPVVSIEQVRLVALMTQDAKGARYFVSQTLGELASASPSLQRSLRAFLQQGCNLTAAAEALHTHRNTMQRRLDRAQALLPRPLADHRLDVSAALELLAWTRPAEEDSE